MTTLVKNEKRQHIRIPANRPVVMVINDASIFATMTDFSKHGIGFITQADVTRGDTVEVHFDISYNKGFHAFQFKATVKHCLKIEDKRHVGVRLKIDENQYTALFDEIYAA